MILIKNLNYDDLKLKLGAAKRQHKYDIVADYFHGLGYTGTMADMEDQFLTANGFDATVGTLGDRWSAYLADAGFSGRLADALRAWARS